MNTKLNHEIQFICPRWGSEHLAGAEFLDRVQQEGYDGIEIAATHVDDGTASLVADAKQRGLTVIAQHWDVFERDLAKHAKELEKRLLDLMSLEPACINSHTGRDLFTLEENLHVFDLSESLANQSGIPVYHETHRARAAHTPWRAAELVEARPQLRFTLDMSHWCAVCETLLGDQEDFLSAVLPHVGHLHARVGHSQGPQVSDPRAPEWEEALNAHLAYWDRVIEANANALGRPFTICPEFGPPPYLPLLPYTRQPIADQWDINSHMMKLLRARYSMEA